MNLFAQCRVFFFFLFLERYAITEERFIMCYRVVKEFYGTCVGTPNWLKSIDF